MTSVEEVVGLARTASAFVPIARPAREHTPATLTLSATSPRVSATLFRRQQWERRFRLRLRISDTLVVVATAAITAAVQLAFLAGSPEIVIRGAVALTIAWSVLLAAMNTRATAVFGAGAAEYRRVANASAVAFGLLAVAGVLLDWDGLRPLLLIALPLGVLSLLYSRWLWRRWLLRRRDEGTHSSRALVVGAAEDIEYVIRTLRDSGDTGYRVVGATLLDGGPARVLVDGAEYPVVGSRDTVAIAAAELGADTIIVASRPEGQPDFVKHLSWQLEGTAAELVLSSRLTDVAGPRISLRQVEGLPLIQVRIPTYEGERHVLKRALDIVVAAVALIPIAAITPVIALLIKLDSPGPVFFRQERVGRDGRTFRMVKFRSMRVDAEQLLAQLQAQNEGAGLLFKMKDDPRITRVGSVLRKFSLDELPQFWNVLLGDMSVVGPRPPLPREVTAYDGHVVRRLYIKPGITGPWQVGGRSDLTWDESVRLDLRYVENWSVMNDLQIMWRTAKVMVQPAGAY